MKVAIVHDDLMQWGGAERVLEAISEIFPDAPIYTSVYNDKNKEIVNRFGGKKIITSFIQNIPGWRSLYKGLLPLYPIAFEQFDFREFDLVISQTTRFAKGIVTKPSTKHICYCHTPPRFLWHFSGENFFGKLELYLNNLRIYDTISSRRVDAYIAGSENAKRRIKKIYRRDSEVVYPFVDLERFRDIEGFDGGYFLVIARANKIMNYKRVDLAVEACSRLGLPLKVIGISSEEAKKDGVDFLGRISDEDVVRVISGCRALIITGIEDFGLTPLEAQALGKPVVAFGEGGVLETVIPKKTGVFFKEQTVESLMKVLGEFRHDDYDKEEAKKNAKRFSKKEFCIGFKETIENLV